MTSTSNISRRQFLKILAVSGAAAGLAYRFNGAIPFEIPAQGPEVIHETHLLMGAIMNLTLIGESQAQVQAAAAAALSEMRRCVQVFSRYDPTSQLALLNSHGILHSPDPSLVTLLQQAQTLHQASDGAFDVSIKPLLDLYQSSQASGSPRPTTTDIRQTLQKVNAEWIVCEESEIAFTHRGMSLTLDGIAKGAVIDAGVEVLRRYGFTNLILEAGGDLLASGCHGEDTPWKIGLRSPRKEQLVQLPRLAIKNRAVATSGDYLQSFASDFSLHHILDPRQGISPSEIASATVIASTALLADALATTVMVAGVKAGLDLIKKIPDCEAYLIDKHLQAFSSPGMKAFLIE